MTKIELVFVPTPAIGHLLSMVEFAKVITQNNNNILIHVIIYHIASNIQPTKINDYIKSQSAEVDPTRLNFITLPTLSNLEDPSTPTSVLEYIKLQTSILKKAVEDHHLKPVAFVLDFFNVSMIDVANELSIPSYIYFISGAGFLCTMLHFQAIADEQGVDDIIELVGDLDSEMDIPGFQNPFPLKFLPELLLEKENGWASFMIDVARKFREVKGIFVNSFLELERYTIRKLEEQDNLPNIYLVGPILSLNNRGDFESKKVSNNDDITCNKIDESNIISWLDEQPESSVVFLCFGSMGCFNMEQVSEIANGLDRSGHRFLWSLRKPVKIGEFSALPSEHEIFEEALPEGFLDRTSHRGKIVSWAPQVRILAHPATGGFVSHCGWNSILESIWFGVPIATWPMYSEQQLIAFTLLKELNLATEICSDYRFNFSKQTSNCLITAKEVSEGVRKLMSMDGVMKQKISDMSRKCRNALEISGGSSYHSLARFMEEVAQKEI